MRFADDADVVAFDFQHVLQVYRYGDSLIGDDAFDGRDEFLAFVGDVGKLFEGTGNVGRRDDEEEVFALGNNLRQFVAEVQPAGVKLYGRQVFGVAAVAH